MSELKTDSLLEIEINNQKITVDLSNDHYGAFFWKKMASNQYEPDTTNFISTSCSELTDFMDIGAANGAMTLLAATKNSRVRSYEPDPKIFSVLTKNVDINKHINKHITTVNSALSNKKSSIKFQKGKNNQILSSIVFTGHENTEANDLTVLSLLEELDDFHTDLGRNVVLKMDIEGAEWRILNDEKTLQGLAQHKAIMLLATHPGFYRPFKRIIRGLDKFRYAYWKQKNFLESRKTFKLLSKYGTVKRTNLDLVTTDTTFARLINAGYNEFVLDFK
jgi:FkbM family methyltransferase